MRVLHVIPAVAARYGGTSTNLWPLLRALNAVTGLTAEVVATDADGPGRQLTSADLPSDLSVRLFPRIGGESLKRSPDLERWLANHARGYDALHVHSLWNRPVTAAAAIARLTGVPYILRPAGMLSAYSWSRGWFKKRAYWWLAERRTVFGAAALHVTSPEEATEIRACGVTASVVELPNGLESVAFDTPRRPEWLGERCGPAAKNRPIVLFLSRLHPKKGVVDTLLPAFARLRGDPFLAIAGDADATTPEYPGKIREMAERLGVADRMTLLGPVAQADRWAAFDGAAVFCLPSHNENFGSVVPEAIARGCPVVVTAGVATGRLAAKYAAGMVVPRTIDAVAGGLKAILADRIGWAERAAIGRDEVRRDLAWNTIAERLVTVYQQIRAGLD